MTQQERIKQALDTAHELLTLNYECEITKIGLRHIIVLLAESERDFERGETDTRGGLP